MPENVLPSAKTQIRHQLRQRRRAIPADVRHHAALSVGDFLTTATWWRSASTVALYMATDEELDIGIATADATPRLQQRYVFPRVMTQPVGMTFHELSATHPTERGPGGIRQPGQDAAVVPADDIDVIVVPLLGCDDRGVRIGYGGGYYDRFLSGCDALRVGVGFSVQRLPRLPSERHDQRLDFFISELGVEQFNR